MKDAEVKTKDKTQPPKQTQQITQTRTKQIKQAQRIQKQTKQTQQKASSPAPAGGSTTTPRLRKFRTPKSALKYTAVTRKPLGPSPSRGAAPRPPSDNEVSLVDLSTSVDSPETRRPLHQAQPAARDPRIGKRLRTAAPLASSPASLVSVTDAPSLVAEPGDLIESLLKAPMAACSDTLPPTPSDGAGSLETSQAAAVLSSTSTSVRKSAALPKDYLYSEAGPLATAKRPRCKGIWFIPEPDDTLDAPKTSKGDDLSVSSRAYKEWPLHLLMCKLVNRSYCCHLTVSLLPGSPRSAVAQSHRLCYGLQLRVARHRVSSVRRHVRTSRRRGHKSLLSWNGKHAPWRIFVYLCRGGLHGLLCHYHCVSNHVAGPGPKSGRVVKAIDSVDVWSAIIIIARCHWVSLVDFSEPRVGCSTHPESFSSFAHTMFYLVQPAFEEVEKLGRTLLGAATRGRLHVSSFALHHFPAFSAILDFLLSWRHESSCFTVFRDPGILLQAPSASCRFWSPARSSRPSMAMPATASSFPGSCLSLGVLRRSLLPLALMQLVQPSVAHTAPQKRAYGRACRRAAAHPLQGTVYRGRWCSLRELMGRWTSPSSARSNSRLRSDALTSGRPTSCHRLKLVTLNVGGLSQMAYAELLQHLQSLPQQAKPDVLLLQETHWREHSEYSTAGWHIIGSANVSPQAGGVAIFVADHLCTAEHILHTSPIPGRILHARLALGGATVDIVNVYQKIAVSSLQSTEKGHQPGTTNRGIRREVWTVLRQLIRGLPHRHVVVVAGDFNTPVKSVNSRVGARADILSSTPPADQGELLDLIHDCDLLHLNSWTRFAKHTFRHGEHASLIDHIFVRHSLGDTISRRSGPISWQLFPWRSGGRHSPVCASIQVPHISALFKRSGPKLRVLDKVTLAQACRNDADPRIWALRNRVGAWLHAHQDATVEAVNAELHSTALDLFPGKLQHGRIVPWQSEQVGMAVRTMWAAYRTWRSTAKACSKHIWRAWAAYSKFCKAHRAFRRSTRQAKTAWFKHQVEVMEASARKGDTRALFQLAARFGPKQKRRKLQLRSEDGGILSHAEQADVLHKFYKNLYCTEAPDTHAQILDSLMNSTLPACPFACLSLDTIPQALQHLSPHKAAPSHLAHTSVWIACSDVVSPWLTRFLQTAQQIPQLWKDTWLSLLPKVATPTLPRQLRPLGISEISGRVVCGLIQDQLRSYVETFLSTEPQFAYMANRSTDQALLRVLLHCTEGRRICEPQAYDLRQARFSCSQSRSESASKKARGGAVQLSLDLTQAFDRLEWGLISDALIAASVPVELYSLIILWHRSLYYHLKVVDATAAVPVQRGVRQGCRIAPMLWAISTVLIMRRADASIGSSWSRDHLTAYADDFHAGEIIRRSEDLSKALWRFGAFLDCLTSAHLVVNSQKSAILLRLCKGLAPAWRRSHIKKGPDGPFLSFCSPGGTRYNIPLKQEHVYLGLVISYHSSETASVSHRTRAAWATWTRLRPALTSASAPARDLRLRLWRACVPPTLLYGLHVIRPTARHLLQLQQLSTRHLRAVARSQAHMTHESTACLHARLGVPSVHDLLSQALFGLRARIGWAVNTGLESTKTLEHCDQLLSALQRLPDPCLLHVQSEPGPTGHTAAEAPSPSEPHETNTLTPVLPSTVPMIDFRCPTCSATFPDLRQLRVHQASHHRLTVASRALGIPFDKMVHSCQGMPICALCHRSFGRWSILQDHIRKGRCPALDSQLCAGRSVPALDDTSAGLEDTAVAATAPLLSSQEHCGAVATGSCLTDAPVPPTISLHTAPLPALHLPGSGSISQSADPSWQKLVGPKLCAPVLARLDVLQRALTSGWQSLLLDVSLRDELRHHCPCCGQWCATAAGMKVHLKSAHACWNDCLAQVVERTKLMKRVIVKPCIYCLDQVFDVQTHWKRCHVLMTCCFIEVYARRHDSCTIGSGIAGSAPAGASQSVCRGAGEGHVPASPLRLSSEAQSLSLCEAPASGSREGGHRGCSDASSGLDRGPLSPGPTSHAGSYSQRMVEGRQGQREEQRPEQGLRQGLRQAQLRNFFPGGRSLEQRSRPLQHGQGVRDGANGSHDASPRTAAAVSPARSKAPPVSASGGARLCRSAYGQGSADLAKADGRRQGPFLTSRNDASRVDTGAPEPYPRVQCQAGDEGKSYADELDGQPGCMELSPVEPRNSAGGAGSSGGESHYREHPCRSQGDRGPDQRYDDQALRLSSSLSSALRDKLGSIHSRDRTSHRWRPSLEAFQCSDKFLGAPPSCSPSSTAQADPIRDCSVPAALPLGESSPQSIPRLSLLGYDLSSFRLLNPTSCTCYMNSFLFAVLFVLHYRGISDQAELGRLRGICDAIAQHSGKLDISKHMHWVMLISPWSQPFRQHDVAEFAQHVLHRLRVPSFQGHWHARRFEAGHCSIIDTGPCTSPVTLPLQGPVTLQDCIDQWHSQHTSALLAFTPGTSFIVLQLMRFNAEGRGKWKRTVKSLHTISHLLDDVVVPTFVDLESMQCLYPRFKVASIIAHFGDRADSGHYRCLWNENNTALIADDAAAITPCALPMFEEISANAYLVFLTRECV